MDPTALHRAEVIARHVCSQQQERNVDHVRMSTTASGHWLNNKVAVITGAGQGIGAETARLFAQHGAKVVVCDIDRAKAEAVAQEIAGQGGEAISFAGDVMAAAFPQKLMDAVKQKFGRLDILVNNAGFTWDGVIHKMSAEQWDAMLSVHCTAPFRLIQAAAPLMRDAAKQEMMASGAAQPRCIINVSSVSGTHGQAGQANYSTAKMGVVGLTKAIAREWGPFNIRCNAIAYGKIATRLVQPKEEGAHIQVGGHSVALGIPQSLIHSSVEEKLIPLGRVGTVEDAAGAMLLLACPYSSYITGQVIEVTGGLYM